MIYKEQKWLKLTVKNVAIALDTAPLEAGQKRAIRQFQKLGSAGDVAKGGLNVVGKGMKQLDS